ncbi:MAG: LL-diaminopimelate aminotransferase [Elusimicrobia bacterium]|nr:LL-diaminopimelate aminotransferase [Elusimicrobiota bacterium]
MIECSAKLKKLPPYVFAVMKNLMKEAYSKKLDVIDLSMGNPDLPTPQHVVNRLVDTVTNHPNTHRYPQAKGMPKFRQAVCQFYKNRFDLTLDPETEALALVGSKEGVGHLAAAILDTGDIALVPGPSYPVHYNGVILAGGQVHLMPLLEENKYLPDLTKVPEDIARKAKLMYINYPNNPTAAVVEDLKFYEEVVAFAKKYDIIIASDLAYSEICFDGYRAPSFLQVPGAMEVGVEFGSCSKTYNMAGWRIGFAVGNAKIIGYLEKFKSYLDYGVFTALQLAGVAALTGPQDCVADMCKIYQHRRDIMAEGLNKLGWKVNQPKATMYLWVPLPEKYKHMKSLEFCEFLLKETGIAVAPGNGFGENGEGYARIALVTHDNRFHDALLRLKKFLR